MSSIIANELKTKGVSVVEDVLRSGDEAVITVRGKKHTSSSTSINTVNLESMSWKLPYRKQGLILPRGASFVRVWTAT